MSFDNAPRVMVQLRKLDHEPLELWYSEAEFRSIPKEGVTLELKRYEK